MLNLDKQNQYRAAYQGLKPGWQPGTHVYERFVRESVSTIAARGTRPCVLDIGCGYGGVLEQLRPLAMTPVGIDADRKSLVSRRETRIQAVAGLGEHSPFRTASFDVVICSWVLEHVTAPGDLFNEIARVLKTSGRFIFLTPNARSPVTRINRAVPGLLQSALVRFIYARREADTYQVAYKANTLEHLEQYAHAAGLTRVSVSTISDPTYLAFNGPLFRASIWLESRLDPAYYVHIVGMYMKAGGEADGEAEG